MSEAQPLESQAAPSGAGVGCQQVHPCPLVGILAVFQELEIKQGEAVGQLVDIGHLADGLEFPDKAALLKSNEFHYIARNKYYFWLSDHKNTLK